MFLFVFQSCFASDFILLFQGNQQLELQQVQDLIAADADVNAQDETGMTALMWAVVRNQSPKVITALIEAGANVNATSEVGS